MHSFLFRTCILWAKVVSSNFATRIRISFQKLFWQDKNFPKSPLDCYFCQNITSGVDVCIVFCSKLVSYELKSFQVILLHPLEFLIKNYFGKIKTSQKVLLIVFFCQNITSWVDVCIVFFSELVSYELKLFQVILLHALEFLIKNYFSKVKTSQKVL